MNNNKNNLIAVAARNLTVGSVLADGFTVASIGTVGMVRGSLYRRVSNAAGLGRMINQCGTQHVQYLAP